MKPFAWQKASFKNNLIESLERGEAPPHISPPLPANYWMLKESKERRSLSYKAPSPLLIKERGIKGVRLIGNPTRLGGL